jgi:hypothetical protein
VEFLEAVDCRVLFQLDATNLHKDGRVRHEKFDRVNFFSRFLNCERAKEIHIVDVRVADRGPLY